MNYQSLQKVFTLSKLANVFFAVVIGSAFAGFFVGVTEIHTPVLPEEKPSDIRPADDEPVQPAVSYSEMREVKMGSNKNWSSHLNTLKYEIPSVTETVPTPALQAKLAALEQRASRRAYSGAPPMVPHHIDQRNSDSCLVCHGKPMRVEERIVPQISHAHFQNCLQCHAEMNNPVVKRPSPLASNTFHGLESPIEGRRAWPGAPPTVPHAITMRSDCRSCHGVNGWPGLRTTHPERMQCLQCHAPSAELNQQPRLPHPPFIAKFAD